MNPTNYTREETDLEMNNETTMKTTTNLKNSTKKPKVTYDDILKSLNLKVNKGVLEYSLAAPPLQTQNTNCNNSLKTCYRKQQNQQQQQQIPFQEKSSYIYSKYFKDYKDHSSVNQEQIQPIYLTKEEIKKRIILNEIRKREERKRIEEVKSKKLLFARNNHFAPTNATPNNLNQLFLLRR
jgi:hypothetical protein